MTNLGEHCASVLLGNTKAGKWNVTKNQKLKAIKFHERKRDSKKEENKYPSETDATESVDVKSFYGFRRDMGQVRTKIDSF